METWGTYERRQEARADLMSHPGFDNAWEQAEANPRDDADSLEPRGFAGGLTPEAKYLRTIVGS